MLAKSGMYSELCNKRTVWNNTRTSDSEADERNSNDLLIFRKDMMKDDPVSVDLRVRLF